MSDRPDGHFVFPCFTMAVSTLVPDMDGALIFVAQQLAKQKWVGNPEIHIRSMRYQTDEEVAVDIDQDEGVPCIQVSMHGCLEWEKML